MAFDGFQIAADFLRWQMSTLPCQIQQGCCELNIVKLMIRDKLDCRYSDLTGARPNTQPSQRWECVCVAELSLQANTTLALKRSLTTFGCLSQDSSYRCHACTFVAASNLRNGLYCGAGLMLTSKRRCKILCKK